MTWNETELENRLSEPTPVVIDAVSRLEGDILLLGVGGKMGPSLARMAKRATELAGVPRKVYGVARFSSPELPAQLEEWGIEPIRCDLLNKEDVARLPDAGNVIHMTGRKFGSTGEESATWAVNCYLPALAFDRFAGAKMVAFSTGNVYPFSPVNGHGPDTDAVLQPVGEYGMSALGRERIFEYFCKRDNSPLAVMRLNYACDLRYGVLVDLAEKVLSGQPIDLGMGHFNTIWQGDANALTLRAFDFAAVPAKRFNLTGPRVLAVREVCQRFGELFGKPPQFVGEEAETALLSDSRSSLAELGPLTMSEDELIDAVAGWLSSGGKRLGKPTHFEARDGRF